MKFKFTFDYAHRLISQGNSSYVYDGGVTQYIYDAAGNLLAEANASNQITHYYIHGLGLLARVDPQPNALYVYHFDGTGHTVAVTNDSRQVINTYAYDPYGKLMALTETIAQPFTYAGQFGVQAEGSNLYYMRARYYDAETGKFISEDPIGFEGGLNLYAYVGGNPIMLVDPSGLAASEAGRVGSVSVPAWARNPIGFAVFAVTYSPSLGDGTLTGNGYFNADANSGDKDPSTPTGQRGSPLDVAPGTNQPASIGDRDYSGHALDRMQGRGVPPSAVEDTIQNGQSSPGNTSGTTVHTGNGVTVVTGEGGRVITVITR